MVDHCEANKFSIKTQFLLVECSLMRFRYYSVFSLFKISESLIGLFAICNRLLKFLTEN
jgi:hypothetical protein